MGASALDDSRGDPGSRELEVRWCHRDENGEKPAVRGCHTGGPSWDVRVPQPRAQGLTVTLGPEDQVWPIRKGGLGPCLGGGT